MNDRPRITLEDSLMSIIGKLCEGNPGACEVCSQAYRSAAQIDPDAALGGLAALMDLDTMGVYGHRIWMLYKDVCHESILNFHACLRAAQLGIVSERKLLDAIDNHGEGIDPEALLAAVQEQLPRFGVTVLESAEVQP